MSEPFVYRYPSTEAVISGVSAMDALAGECRRLGAGRVVVLTTRSLTGRAGRCRDLLGEQCAGVLVATPQHVPLDAVSSLLGQVAELRPDVLVSFGGGSVIDAAKAAAAALAHGYRDARQIYAHRIRFSYPDTVEMEPFSGPFLPHIAVPTTLSAAEYDGIFGMTCGGTKDLYSDPGLAPRSVILDPRETLGTPGELWASSGIRALDHAVEIYLSRVPTPLTDAAALGAVEMLAENLPATMSGPGEPAGGERSLGARLRCLQAGWLSMVGVENAPLGLSHGIGHQLGARCGVPHGVTSCVLLPTVLEFLLGSAPARRMARLSTALGAPTAGLSQDEAAALLPNAVRSLIASLGLPTRISEVGVSADAFEALARDAMADMVVASAPVAVTQEDIQRLLEKAL